MRDDCPNCYRSWTQQCGEGVYCEHCGEPQMPRPNPDRPHLADNKGDQA